MAKSMALGGGGRFAAFKSKVEKEGYSPESAGAIAADAGRKKYGKKKFQSLSAAGRKHSSLSKAIEKRRSGY